MDTGKPQPSKPYPDPHKGKPGRWTRLKTWWRERKWRREAKQDYYYMTPGARRAILRRDIWNLLITGIATYAAIVAVNTSDDTNQLIQDLADTRARAVLDGCQNDQAQDNVVRAILSASLEQRTRLEAQGLDQDGPNVGPRERRMLVEELMAPLGGLDITEKQLKLQCAERLLRGTPKEAAEQILKEQKERQ